MYLPMKNCLIAFCLAWLTISCGCPQGDELPQFSDSRLFFTIEDSTTGKNLYGIPSDYPQYSIDTLSVTGSAGITLYEREGSFGYSFTLYDFYDPSRDGLETQTRTLYLYLNAVDIDTLILSFTPDPGKCSDSFNNISALYNGTDDQLCESSGVVICTTLRKQL